MLSLVCHVQCDTIEEEKTMEASHLSTSQSRSLYRKTIEKNRRMQMKALYSELVSLLPNHTSRETLTLPDQLDEAAKYIKKLQVNVEKMRERKMKLIATSSFERLNPAGSSSSVDVSVSRRLPKLEIQDTGSIIHIILVTSLEHKFVFYEIIRILTEELGAEITHAGYSMVDDSLFHTIHCKVEVSNYGARRQIPERLENYVNSVNHL